VETVSANPCNLCLLRDIRRRAEAAGKVVHLVVREMGPEGLGGTDVFVCPPDVELDTEAHFAAWMWEISKDCAC
jgi:hypothetical protein